MKPHSDPVTLSHRFGKAVAHNIRWVTRIPLVFLSVFLLIHHFYPPIIEWIIHMDNPSAVFVNLGGLGIALLVIILEKVVVLDQKAEEAALKVFRQHTDLYQHLALSLKKLKPKRAFLIQYSAITCLDLIRTLREHGAEVTIYIQNPSTAQSIGSLNQQERIQGRLRQLKNELASLYDQKYICLRQYDVPASLSAVLIDDTLLGLGWYTYLHKSDTSLGVSAGNDKVLVRAHDYPALLATSGSTEFHRLHSWLSEVLRNFEENSHLVVLP